MPNDWYANDIQIRLAQSLKKGNERAAIETVDAMLERIKTKHVSIDMLKCYCFDIINVLFRAATSVKYSDPEQMKEMVNFSSIENLETHTYRFIRGLCRKVKENKLQDSRMLHEQIIGYIHGHYKTYDRIESLTFPANSKKQKG